MLQLKFILAVAFFLSITTAENYLNCPRSVAYWESHNVLSSKEPWPFKAKAPEVEFTELNPMMNGTTTWYEVIKQTRDRNLCRNAASQLIAHYLNGGERAEARGNGLELSRIIETSCKRNTETSSLTNYVVRRLSELTSYFNILNSEKNGCVVYNELDCNGNKVRDLCEIDSEELRFICERRNYRNSVFQNCKLDANMTDGDLCNIILRKQGKDCNKNRILDECETKSISTLSCENKYCWFVPDGEKIHSDCAKCHSMDIDKNGVPDECEDPGFVEIVSPKDCNQNFIEDSLEVDLLLVEDTNGNRVPDECEIGFYCDAKDYNFCKETSLSKAENKNKLVLGKICSQQKTSCVPSLPGDQIGSCCRRTSAINGKIICEEQVKRDYCVGALGGIFNKDPICGNHTCSNPTGSCCKSGETSLCFHSLSLTSCRSSFKNYIFDLRKDCSSLCSPSNETMGTCVINGECVMDINILECKNLRGVWDYIPCFDRLDMKEEKIGSCCLRDKENRCQDFVSEYDCMTRNGKFSMNKCHEEGYCLDKGPEEDLGDCCWEEETLTCEKTKSKCQHSEIKCNSNPFCRMLRFFPQGCCLFNNGTTCMKLKGEEGDEEKCTFFGGSPLEHTECVKESSCLLSRKENPEVEEIKKIKQDVIEKDQPMRLPAVTGDGERNVTGPYTVSTPEQFAATTFIVFVSFFVIFLFVGGWFLLEK